MHSGKAQVNVFDKAPVMTAVTALTDRFDRALLYATHVHGGQVRKETAIPYVAHLLAVAATVLEYGGSEEMAIARLLHDAAEDQEGEPRLARKEDWRTRKMRYIDHFKTVDRETFLVRCRTKFTTRARFFATCVTGPIWKTT